MADANDLRPRLLERIRFAAENLPVLRKLRDLERRQHDAERRQHDAERRERDAEMRLQEVARATAETCDQLAPLIEELRQMRAWLSETSDRGDATAGLLETFIADQQRSLERLEARVAADGPLDGKGDLALETFESELGGTVVGFRDGGQDVEGDVYREFERYFRGSEEQIRDRQRDYLPLLASRSPVLDVGCGRGELLELLRDAGVRASGIDLDGAMVQRCRDKGLDAIQGDAVRHLVALPGASLGAIVAAQVIEHLSYEQLLRFLRAAREALVPSGMLIMETVNPHAPQALKHFWIDPTHQHPLFGETVLALCRLTGFVSAYVRYPQGIGDPDRDRLQQPDYAVVAQTTASGD